MADNHPSDELSIANYPGFGRMVRICFAIMLAAGGSLAVVRLFLGEVSGAIPGLAVSAVAGICLLTIKNTKTILTALYILCFVFMLGQILHMLKGGGLYSPSVMWFGAIPILGLVLPSDKLIRICLCSLFILGFFYWGPQFGWIVNTAPQLDDSTLFVRYMIDSFAVVAAVGAGLGLRKGYIKIFTQLQEKERKLKQVAEEIAASELKLQEFLKERNSLLRMLTHDLATPLMSIELSLYQIEKKNEVTPDNLRRMKIATGSIKELGSHVRELIAIESGKVEIATSVTDLRQKLLDMKEMIQPTLAQKNVDLVMSVPSEPIFVHAKEVHLKNIVMNLLSNAIKFSHPNGKVELHCVKSETHVVFTVRDHGIGIPEELVGQIFSFDKKTSRLGTSGEKGTGFGLPLVLNYIQALGGKIQVHSNTQEGQSGTAFEVTLPLASETQAPTKKAA